MADDISHGIMYPIVFWGEQIKKKNMYGIMSVIQTANEPGNNEMSINYMLHPIEKPSPLISQQTISENCV